MYRDANGIEHESYNDACRYYGAETIESLAAEDRAQQEEYEQWAKANPQEAARLGLLPNRTNQECPF